MAAMRSALAMLSRRSFGSSGSSAVASMGGRGLEIHQVFRSAAPRTPPLRPPAIRNLEGWRQLTTGGREPAGKAECLRLWWQQVRDRVENANAEESARGRFVYGLFTMGTASCYALKTTVDLYRHTFKK
ncbi:hypothetical protein EJB05_40761 [Eragrostis curvula]|uniref:Uncharacterized protein n=1 Tax=Eragrostis curvula TaxID=38414 RepID=A0A5J9TP99_9POAL|nr:hypothetical protein EJB05_40761 [Eragrostis curvula]